VNKEQLLQELYDKLETERRLYEELVQSGKISVKSSALEKILSTDPKERAVEIVNKLDEYISEHVKSILASGPTWHRGKRINLYFQPGLSSETIRYLASIVDEFLREFDFRRHVKLCLAPVDYTNIVNKNISDGAVDERKLAQDVSQVRNGIYADILFLKEGLKQDSLRVGWTEKDVVIIGYTNDRNLAELRGTVRHELGTELFAYLPHCEEFVGIVGYGKYYQCVGGSGGWNITDEFCPKCKYLITQITRRLAGIHEDSNDKNSVIC
jgi:hypothetical protein